MHRSEGGGKDIHYSAKSAALFVNLFYNIFCRHTYKIRIRVTNASFLKTQGKKMGHGTINTYDMIIHKYQYLLNLTKNLYIYIIPQKSLHNT